MAGSVAVSLVVAAVAAFVLSSLWYMAWGSRLAKLSPAYGGAEARPSAVEVALEVLRSLVVAVVLAVLADWTGSDGWLEGAGLGLLAWVGFPLMILAGSVLHEGYPRQLAAIHQGDWLVKLLVIGAIVAAVG
jgi:hypothetical protein